MVDALVPANAALANPSNIIDISTPTARVRLKIRQAQTRDDMQDLLPFFREQARNMSPEEFRTIWPEALEQFCRMGRENSDGDCY